MKPKWRKAGIVALWVLGILLFLLLLGYFRNMVAPWRVNRAELHTYDHDSYCQAELTDKEKWTLTMLYNLSREAGEVDAEPCCPAYGFYLHLSDGSHIYVGEGVKSKMILRDGDDDRYLASRLMIRYIRHLADKYDLPID